jgi:hypothetical protein
MIKIYSKQGMARQLNNLVNGCDAEFYLVDSGWYVRVIMKNNKYYVSVSGGRNFRPFIFKEEISLDEVKEIIYDIITKAR